MEESYKGKWSYFDKCYCVMNNDNDDPYDATSSVGEFCFGDDTSIGGFISERDARHALAAYDAGCNSYQCRLDCSPEAIKIGRTSRHHIYVRHISSVAKDPVATDIVMSIDRMGKHEWRANTAHARDCCEMFGVSFDLFDNELSPIPCEESFG